MDNTAILGSLWGDEGKGHITHALSTTYDWVVRFNGGANAGHTLYRNGKKYVHNLLPSVDFNRSKYPKSYLGAGMVIDLEKLLAEVTEAEKDFPGVGKTIYVDKDAHIVFDWHKDEDKTKNSHIGSTNRGIGPAYRDRVARQGTSIGDAMLHDDTNSKSNQLDALRDLGVNFVYSMELYEQMRSQRILFEGAQGIMLDINHGIYPFVSCSDCTVSGIAASGFGRLLPSSVLGVCKVYLTKVGGGPMPTEIHGEEAEALRKAGNEYGATTGRPRRIGWLDLPALRYAIAKSGINGLVLTKFDILNGMDKIKVCTSYEKEPVCSNDFFKTKTNIIEVDGWQDAQDHKQILNFVNFIEKETGVPVVYTSCGINKDDIMLPHSGLRFPK